MSYTNEKVYAAPIEQGVAGITTILDKVSPLEIKSTFNYMWTVEKVNFRTEPHTDSDIIETLDKRTKVEVIEEIDEWSKVKYGDITGYICNYFLRDTKLPSINFTDDEVKMLQQITEAECTGQSIEAKMNVASVIINRIISADFPDDMESVIFQASQFSPIADKRYWKVDITNDTILAVKNVLKDGVTNDEALFFCNMDDIKKSSNLEWFRRLKILFTDDSGHTFYRIIKED
jgi:N-acetylmuramoyl-L-alanine amidase